MTYKIFETDRLIIRPANETDAKFYLTLLNSPKWLQYIGDRAVKTEAAAKTYIKEKMIPQLERLGYSNYTIIRKIDGEKIGCCGLYDREGLDGVDIGFALLSTYEKQGYAFEATHRLKEAATEAFGITKLLAITTEENKDSQKLLTKLGLTCQGPIHLKEEAEPVMLYEWGRE